MNVKRFVIAIFWISLLPLFASAQQRNIQFEETNIPLLQVMASATDWGDFNGDGNLDLVVTGRINPDKKDMIIYQNEGGGSFSEVGADLIGISEGDVEWGDFDGDGDLDLAAVGWNSTEDPTATIYENEGGGTFTPLDVDLQPVTYGSTDWGDFDGDGDLDLIITGANNGLTPTTTLYENEGNGEFTPADANLMGVWKGSAEWGDYNGDGNLDLVLTGRDREEFPIAVIYENNGDGTFTQVGADLMGAFGGSSSDWGDFDGDGDPDLLISGWNANIEPATVVYENQGNGQFSSTDARLMGVNDGMARWLDYDNNDRLDIMVTGSNADQEAITRIYKNEPDTSFVLTDIAIKGTWRSSFSAGDYDNDGLLDIVISGADYYNERMSTIYRNLGQTEASSEQSP